jgi:hypothetical protein
MHPTNIYESARFADLRSFQDRPLPFDQSPHEAAYQLTRRP